jgi:hypothetical protein
MKCTYCTNDNSIISSETCCSGCDRLLDDLIDTFDKHSKKFQKDRIEFKTKYPDSDFANNPEFEFNISLAFKIMCDQIKHLKKII